MLIYFYFYPGGHEDNATCSHVPQLDEDDRSTFRLSERERGARGQTSAQGRPNSRHVSMETVAAMPSVISLPCVRKCRKIDVVCTRPDRASCLQRDL